jgi:hypothetical protein
MFSPITRIGEVLESGDDYQVIQTNVSLLNKATQEAQDRLLKLERTIFGIDTQTLPKGINIENSLYNQSYIQNKFTPYSQSLTDIGIIRIIKELFNKNILIDTLYDLSNTNSVMSNFYDVYLELYGDCTDWNEWYSISGLYNDPDGKFHSVYIWARNKILWEREYIKNIY